MTLLMEEKTDHVRFWLDGASAALDGCASICGRQGFETDHAGMVWGDDLVIRQSRWALGNPDN